VTDNEIFASIVTLSDVLWYPDATTLEICYA